MTTVNDILMYLKTSPLPCELSERLDWVRELLPHLHDSQFKESEPYLWLVAFDSETDHFPSQDVRQLWSENALKNSDENLMKDYQNDLMQLDHIYKKLLKMAQEVRNK